MLYSLIQKILKLLIFIKCYITTQIKKTSEEVERMFHFQTLPLTVHGNIWKAHIKTTNLKYLLQHEMIDLNYQMDYICGSYSPRLYWVYH